MQGTAWPATNLNLENRDGDAQGAAAGGGKGTNKDKRGESQNAGSSIAQARVNH